MDNENRDKSRFPFEFNTSKEILEQRINGWNTFFEKYSMEPSNRAELRLDTLEPVNEAKDDFVPKERLPMRNPISSIQYWVDTGKPPCLFVINENYNSTIETSLPETEASIHLPGTPSRIPLHSPQVAIIQNNRNKSTPSVASSESVNTRDYILSSNIAKKQISLLAGENVRLVDNHSESTEEVDTYVDVCGTDEFPPITPKQLNVSQTSVNSQRTTVIYACENSQNTSIVRAPTGSLKIEDVIPSLRRICSSPVDYNVSDANSESIFSGLPSASDKEMSQADLAALDKKTHRRKLFTNRDSPVEVVEPLSQKSSKLSGLNIHPALESLNSPQSQISNRKKKYSPRKSILNHDIENKSLLLNTQMKSGKNLKKNPTDLRLPNILESDDDYSKSTEIMIQNNSKISVQNLFSHLSDEEDDITNLFQTSYGKPEFRNSGNRDLNSESLEIDNVETESGVFNSKRSSRLEILPSDDSVDEESPRKNPKSSLLKKGGKFLKKLRNGEKLSEVTEKLDSSKLVKAGKIRHCSIVVNRLNRSKRSRKSQNEPFKESSSVESLGEKKNDLSGNSEEEKGTKQDVKLNNLSKIPSLKQCSVLLKPLNCFSTDEKKTNFELGTSPKIKAKIAKRTIKETKRWRILASLFGKELQNCSVKDLLEKSNEDKELGDLSEKKKLCLIESDNESVDILNKSDAEFSTKQTLKNDDFKNNSLKKSCIFTQISQQEEEKKKEVNDSLRKDTRSRKNVSRTKKSSNTIFADSSDEDDSLNISKNKEDSSGNSRIRNQTDTKNLPKSGEVFKNEEKKKFDSSDNLHQNNAEISTKQADDNCSNTILTHNFFSSDEEDIFDLLKQKEMINSCGNLRNWPRNKKKTTEKWRDRLRKSSLKKETERDWKNFKNMPKTKSVEISTGKSNKKNLIDSESESEDSWQNESSTSDENDKRKKSKIIIKDSTDEEDLSDNFENPKLTDSCTNLRNSPKNSKKVSKTKLVEISTRKSNKKINLIDSESENEDSWNENSTSDKNYKRKKSKMINEDSTEEDFNNPKLTDSCTNLQNSSRRDANNSKNVSKTKSEEKKKLVDSENNVKSCIKQTEVKKSLNTIFEDSSDEDENKEDFSETSESSKKDKSDEETNRRLRKFSLKKETNSKSRIRNQTDTRNLPKSGEVSKNEEKKKFDSSDSDSEDVEISTEKALESVSDNFTNSSDEEDVIKVLKKKEDSSGNLQTRQRNKTKRTENIRDRLRKSSLKKAHEVNFKNVPKTKSLEISTRKSNEKKNLIISESESENSEKNKNDKRQKSTTIIKDSTDEENDFNNTKLSDSCTNSPRKEAKTKSFISKSTEDEEEENTEIKNNLDKHKETNSSEIFKKPILNIFEISSDEEDDVANTFQITKSNLGFEKTRQTNHKSESTLFKNVDGHRTKEPKNTHTLINDLFSMTLSRQSFNCDRKSIINKKNRLTLGVNNSHLPNLQNSRTVSRLIVVSSEDSNDEENEEKKTEKPVKRKNRKKKQETSELLKNETKLESERGKLKKKKQLGNEEILSEKAKKSKIESESLPRFSKFEKRKRIGFGGSAGSDSEESEDDASENQAKKFKTIDKELVKNGADSTGENDTKRKKSLRLIFTLSSGEEDDMSNIFQTSRNTVDLGKSKVKEKISDLRKNSETVPFDIFDISGFKLKKNFH